MDLKKLALFGTLLLLTACNRQPWVPYVEPAPGTDTAKLRVITNGEVRGGSYVGCVGNEQGLAKAGRFSSDGKPAINYPQSPQVPRQIGMPARTMPTLPQYLGVISMAEGAYTEIVAEYPVPAGTPFLLVSEEMAIGIDGRRYFKCPAVSQVYTFEKGKSYEAYTGMLYRTAEDGSVQRRCPFLVYELHASGHSIPIPLASTQPSSQPCPSR